MNLQPWITGDLAGQENEGYLEGQRHCKQGWCTDNSSDDSGMDTPFLRGYRRGWDDTQRAGLHGTEPIKRQRPVWTAEMQRQLVGDGPNQEVAEILAREIN